MINRIRDIRRAKGWTLADLAAACDPVTTPQTIGRLETGTRNLSIVWMQRIGDALGIEPETLVRSEGNGHPKVVARLVDSGVQGLGKEADAVLPSELGGDAILVVLAIETGAGEYRAGDQLWLRQIPIDDAARAINRDVLVPRTGGRFTFGRLIDRQGTKIGVLPPGIGEKQLVVDNPPWLACAEMLVRPL